MLPVAALSCLLLCPPVSTLPYPRRPPSRTRDTSPVQAFLLPGKFSTQTCTQQLLHLVRSLLERHLLEARPGHRSQCPTPVLMSPSLFPAVFLCCPHHLTHRVLPDSELSKVTHCACSGHCCIFCTQHRSCSITVCWKNK